MATHDGIELALPYSCDTPITQIRSERIQNQAPGLWIFECLDCLRPFEFAIIQDTGFVCDCALDGDGAFILC
jgi:hypothetical protein